MQTSKVSAHKPDKAKQIARLSAHERDNRSASQQEKANVLNIAMSVGFSSKSDFNNAFKKQTGMTPYPISKKIGRAESAYIYASKPVTYIIA